MSSDLDRTIFATSGALQLVPIVVEGKCSFIDISMLDGCSNHHHAADVLTRTERTGSRSDGSVRANRPEKTGTVTDFSVRE